MNSRTIGHFLARNGTLVGCILLATFFYYWNSNFLSFLNLRNIGEAVSALGIVSIPLALLMIGGGVDLSVGSVASLSGVVCAICMIKTGSVVLGIVAGLAVGLLAGLINGFLISYYRFNSIVVTLGALSVWGGLALNLTGGRTVINLPESFTELELIKFLGLRLDVFILLATILYGLITLELLPYGRRLRAVGGNPRAAFLMGVPVERVQFLMFIQVGLAAAIAGIMLASKLAAATPVTGQGLEINALTVVLLGGVAFTGGVGHVSRVVAGLLFVGVLRNGLVFLNTSQFLQQILIGLTLIVAIVFDETIRKLGRERSEDRVRAPSLSNNLKLVERFEKVGTTSAPAKP
jgi:ribose/xylose/arabinose/galactoside ABC-type transport system permease subunit